MEWTKNIKRAATGQNATIGATKYSLARRLLEDRVLQAFENVARMTGNETNENYQMVIKVVSAHVMPKKAFQKQKRYMQRFLRKPINMKVKDFVE